MKNEDLDILVVFPVHFHSVRDVAIGFNNGFESCGSRVKVFDVAKTHQFFKSVFNNFPKDIKSSITVQMDKNKAISDEVLRIGKEYRNKSKEELAMECLTWSVITSGLIDHIMMSFSCRDNPKRKKPADVVFVVDGRDIDVSRIKVISEQTQVVTALYLTDEPYDNDRSRNIYAPVYDVVFLNDRSTLNMFDKNKSVHYLPVGFDSRIRAGFPAQKKYDLSFVGTFTKERADMFNSMQDFLETKKTFFAGLFPGSSEMGKFKDFVTDKDSWIIKKMIEAGNIRDVPISETSKIYCKSKIVLNLHRDSAWIFNQGKDKIIAESLNPRTYEVAASGVFQLVDSSRKELREKFTEDEMVTFDSVEDLKRKIDYYLENPDEAKKIAMNAKRRVMSEHTYTHRAKDALNVLTNFIDERSKVS